MIHIWITYAMQLKRSKKSKTITLFIFMVQVLQFWRERYPYCMKSGNIYSCKGKISSLDAAILFLSERAITVGICSILRELPSRNLCCWKKGSIVLSSFWAKCVSKYKYQLYLSSAPQGSFWSIPVQGLHTNHNQEMYLGRRKPGVSLPLPW